MANQVIIYRGNLGSDPDLRSSENGKRSVCRFSVAENVYRRDPNHEKTFVLRHVNWFHVTAFGELAIQVAEKLKKGDRVRLEGELRTFQIMLEGRVKRIGVEIVLSKYQLLSKGNKSHEKNLESEIAVDSNSLESAKTELFAEAI